MFRNLAATFAAQISLGFLLLLLLGGGGLYAYLRYEILSSAKNNIESISQNIQKSGILYSAGQSFYLQSLNKAQNELIFVEILNIDSIKQNKLLLDSMKNPIFIESKNTKINPRKYLEYFAPYGADKILHIAINMQKEQEFLNKVLKGLCFIFVFSLVMILGFGLAFFGVLYRPVLLLSKALAELKESNLEPIPLKKMPLEFSVLISSINALLARTKAHFDAQKQLFIGIAHELKTPLAVLKTKAEVVLLKERSNAEYCEALKENIKSVNELNALIKTLLNLGRLESAQFEKNERFDLQKLLQKQAENFKILAQKENIIFSYKIPQTPIFIESKEALLSLIVQNFLQNAFKFAKDEVRLVCEFSAPSSKDSIESNLKTSAKNDFKNIFGVFKIVVLDNGEGIASEINDIYAPFARAGNKSGAGLGLFLAKSAALALNGQISLKNRDDKKGAKAEFSFNILSQMPI